MLFSVPIATFWMCICNVTDVAVFCGRALVSGSDNVTTDGSTDNRERWVIADVSRRVFSKPMNDN